MSYSAKSRDDMRAIAKRLAFSRPDQHVFLAASIAGHGMMLPQLWMRAVVAFGAWRNGVPKGVVWANVMKRYPEIANQTINETVKWITTGKDADGEGVGGFNQREVDQLSRLLDMAEQPS